MRKFLVALLLTVLLLLASVALQAQEGYTEADAIALAAEYPFFAVGLEQNPGWSAAAYDTGNRYGIWRVQFWSASGVELAWADVSPQRGKVYSWEGYFGATDAQRNAAEPVLRDLVSTDPRLIDLLEDPSQYDIYIDYDAWNRWWGVYIDVGADSIWTAYQFEGKTPEALENPQSLGIWFSNVLTYAEWQESNKATAIATAFQNPEIADATTGIDHWTTWVEPADEQGIWTVYFMDGETVLAQVQVDVPAGTVVDYTIGGE